MAMSFRFTVRDEEILRMLSLYSRVVGQRQASQHWYNGDDANCRRRMKQLGFRGTAAFGKRQSPASSRAECTSYPLAAGRSRSVIRQSGLPMPETMANAASSELHCLLRHDTHLSAFWGASTWGRSKGDAGHTRSWCHSNLVISRHA